MTDLDKMARSLLDLCGSTTAGDNPHDAEVVPPDCALRAIRTALLTAPPGWKLVPEEPKA